MNKIITIIIFTLIFFGCSVNSVSNNYHLYEVSDMDDLVRDYYTNDLKNITPGLACGNFKLNNQVGCFKLVLDQKNGIVQSLIYYDYSNESIEKIYDFDIRSNWIFIEKIYTENLESSSALAKDEKVYLKKNQPSLRLVFFEKSSVVFYWKDGKFSKIWTSD